MADYFASLGSNSGDLVVGIFNKSPLDSSTKFFLTNTAFIGGDRGPVFIPVSREQVGVMYPSNLDLSNVVVEGITMAPVITIFSDTPIVTPTSSVRIAIVNGPPRTFGPRTAEIEVARFVILPYGVYVFTDRSGQRSNTLTSIDPFLSFIRGGSPLAKNIEAYLEPFVSF